MRGTIYRRFNILAVTMGVAVVFCQYGYSATLPDGQSSCIVVDPTSTPLNIRTAPYGQIVGTIPNGQPVLILSKRSDARDEPWVYIADANSQPIGWVFKQYLVCR